MADDKIEPLDSGPAEMARGRASASPLGLGDMEAQMSFGEPLNVSVTRAATRFQSIQRGRTQSPAEVEEGEFDVRAWLIGQQEKGDGVFAKRFGLLFRDLNIYGSDVRPRHIGTLITPLWKLIKGVRNGYGVFELLKGTKGRHLIRDFTGDVREGEMLLVLGRPDAGCSTLLRVLGNHRKTYTKITGTVSYGGMSPKEIHRHYRGEVAYNQEEDMHFSTLTVRKTLEFAIQCKTPSRQVLPDSRNHNREVLDALFEVYGLGRCADTIVGNAFLRGVSGGERKRVSIAEQVAVGSSIQLWDGSTRGLDSSSALDYVRSLRIGADVMKQTVLATIYQASESIYKLFDKVLVIEEGRQVYFGPTNKAVAYFEALGIQKPARQTTADFLTGITQLNERRVAPGFEDKAPRTPEEFEAAWRGSAEYAAVQKSVDAFEEQIKEDQRAAELREFVDRTKMGTAWSKLRRLSPYTTTILYQLLLLIKREWGLIIGQPARLLYMFTYYVAFAIIGGTLFIRLPHNTSSYFSRGGLLFYTILFNALTSMSEIPKAMSGRLVIYKHKALAMYHPGALSLAQTVTDLPFAVLQVLVFGSIVYWATALQRYGGQFLAFLLFLFMTTMCMTALFRLMGQISPNLDFGHSLSGITLLFMVLYVGYLIPPQMMHHYFKWIYWINPMAYGFKALLSNEYRNINYPCASGSLVPDIPGASIANRVCTVTGSVPGSLRVRGRKYLEDGFQIYVQDQWKDFIAVTCFWILFVILNTLVIEFVEFGNVGYTTKVFKRYRPNVSKLQDEYVEGDASERPFANIPEGGPSDEQIARGTTYTWKGVNYTVPVKGGQRQLLHDVSGYIKPGTMTALMGSSGAGKTTLLDALSQRKTIGRLEGEILMNGAPQPRSFRRVTGYCEQLDVHNPFATVREALRFSACLRRPAAVLDSEKNAYVERVIYLLGLTDIADCQIGSPTSGEGISLEERKRLTIGIELVSRPKILFLDEPTSGLDAQASFKIVQFMRVLAAEGQTILCTIHQPSALLFEQFDRLLLLMRGGHTVYFGDLGPDAQTLIQYFERNGAEKCPPTANPAEYILDAVNSGKDWSETWRSSDERSAVLGEIDRINHIKETSGHANSEADESTSKYARPLPVQIHAVTMRMLRGHWRDRQYNLMRLALQIVCALVVGFSFINEGDGVAQTQNKIFAILDTAILSVLIINQVQPQFLRQRLYYGRESSSNMYGWEAFTFAVIFTEWPFAIFCNSIFFVCFYWIVDFGAGAPRVGYFYLMYILLGIFSVSIAQGIASFSPNEVVIMVINPIFTTMMTMFCGVIIPYADMPLFWRRWMYWVSPYHYYIEGVMVSTLYNRPIRCRPSDMRVFIPPAGQTCGQYAGNWISTANGYIYDLAASDFCQYCPYKLGQEYYHRLDWWHAHKWRNFGILIGFTGFNLVFATVMTRLYKVNKR
ncbi:ATP-binding cassette transporter snq2 [Coemansia javaensis]|uniref:ATP-binding cassette transporter snq2 n=1 Tax=Coemansia javaensis TaxID=2761396 RepID=A0A9W8HGA7_9FUNG|nr:ATP-binding cassette transporter snq2 [Coemansia javaensis]